MIGARVVWILLLAGWLAGAAVAVLAPRRLPDHVLSAVPLRWDTMAIGCFFLSAALHWLIGWRRLRRQP